MGIVEILVQAEDDKERIKVLTLAIRKAMAGEWAVEEYGEGRFALGYLVTWLKEKLREG